MTNNDHSTIPQTSTLTEHAYGALLERQEQLRDETRAIIERRHNRKQFWKMAEELATILILIAMFSMGAWLGPLGKFVLQLLGAQA